MQQDNDVKIESMGDFTLFDIKGDITAFSESSLTQAYQNATERGAGKIILKFEDGTYINSGGIAVLIQILAQTKKHDQQISITGLSDHFKKIFRMVGITKFADIHDSVDDAMQTMPPGS